MYKMVGADNKEYGPITAEQLRAWMTQGRANARTLISFEGGAWKPLNTFPEFAPSFAPAGFANPALNYGRPPRKNQAATIGLVLSVLGLVCCGYVGAIVGIVLCAIGLSQIKENPERYLTPASTPKAGLVVGVIALIIHSFFYFGGYWDELIKSLP